ncbi:hypothetical protein ACFIOY_04550 [Bradyrhizobium sp. TZ2]
MAATDRTQARDETGLLDISARALAVLIKSEPKLWILVLTRFLHANRYPLRSKTLQTVAPPPVPMTVMMMAMVVMMVPAVPTMMVVVMMAVVSPVHFRRRQPGILLNRCGGAGIAER